MKLRKIQRIKHNLKIRICTFKLDFMFFKLKTFIFSAIKNVHNIITTLEIKIVSPR